MCWNVHINGKTVSTRDALEAEIGENVFYTGDVARRLDRDHCLCPVDVPGTLVSAGYWVRGWIEGDPGMPGDHFARLAAPEQRGDDLMQETEVLIVNARLSGDGNWGWPNSIILTMRTQDGEDVEATVAVQKWRKISTGQEYVPE